MWRSPSFPQMHQKYIYMWNNSYRTPTECWQKTSDFPKGKKSPTYMGRAKEKRKNRDKRIGMGPAPWEEAVKEEKFPHTRKPLHWWRRGWGEWGGTFRATEESTAIRVQRAKQRDSCTEDQCQPALTSLRGLSAYPLARMGGCWELRLGLWRSNPREQTGVGCVNTA